MNLFHPLVESSFIERIQRAHEAINQRVSHVPPTEKTHALACYWVKLLNSQVLGAGTSGREVQP